MEYDALSPAQKKWVCDAAKKVLALTRADTQPGINAGIIGHTHRECRNMPAAMAGMVESLAGQVLAGKLAESSLDTP